MSELDILPLISEKSFALAEKQTYTFLVPIGLNKIQIGQAIKKRFNVNPIAVNTAFKKGKSLQTVVKRGRQRIQGRRSNVKKAYITLAKGDTIAIFEEKSK